MVDSSEYEDFEIEVGEEVDDDGAARVRSGGCGLIYRSCFWKVILECPLRKVNSTSLPPVLARNRKAASYIQQLARGRPFPVAPTQI